MAKQNKTKWDALSMKDRASFIRVCIKNGITDIEEIKRQYNEYSHTLERVDKTNTSDGGIIQKIDNWISNTPLGKFMKKHNLVIKNNSGNSEATNHDNYILRPSKFDRIRENDSRGTQQESSAAEDRIAEMQRNLQTFAHKKGYTSDEDYYIPYNIDQEIKTKMGRVTKNMLDSLAVNAEKEGIPIEEAIGLAALETHFGASPNRAADPDASKEEKKKFERISGNMSYARSRGGIYPQFLVNDHEWSIRGSGAGTTKRLGLDTIKSPLQHAFRLYKHGLYNPGETSHTMKVQSLGKDLMTTDPAIIQWKKEYDNKKATGGELEGLEGLPIFMYRPEYMQQAAQDYITDNQVFGDYNIPEVEVSRQGKKLPSVNSKEGKERIKFLAQRIANGDSTLDAVPTKYKKNVKRYLSGIEFGKEVAKREGYEGLQAFATAAPLAAVPGIFSTMAAATPSASAVINPSSLMNPITKGQLAKQLALDMGWGTTGYEGTNKLSEWMTGKPFNQAVYDQLTSGLSPEDIEMNREWGEAVLDMANPGGWLGLNPATDILRKSAKTTKNVASGVYKTATNPQYRRNHIFYNIEPYSYADIPIRGGKALYSMLTDSPIDINNPIWNIRPTKHIDIPITVDAKGREDAWRIYLHLPQKYNSYIENPDGTYTYNLPEIIKNTELDHINDLLPTDKHFSFEIGYNRDVLTGAGGGLTGNVHTELARTPQGDILGLQTIRDTWDLQPFDFLKSSNNPILRSIGNFEIGKLVGGKPFEMITDVLYVTSPTPRQGKILDVTLNPEEYQAAIKASRIDLEKARRTNRKLLEDFDRRFEYIPLDAPIPDILKEGEIPIGRLKMPNRKKIKK